MQSSNLLPVPDNRHPDWFKTIVSITLPVILTGLLYLVVQYNNTDHLRREFDTHVVRGETKISEFDNSKIELALVKKDLEELKTTIKEIKSDVSVIKSAVVQYSSSRK